MLESLDELQGFQLLACLVMLQRPEDDLDGYRHAARGLGPPHFAETATADTPDESIAAADRQHASPAGFEGGILLARGIWARRGLWAVLHTALQCLELVGKTAAIRRQAGLIAVALTHTVLFLQQLRQVFRLILEFGEFLEIDLQADRLAPLPVLLQIGFDEFAQEHAAERIVGRRQKAREIDGLGLLPCPAEFFQAAFEAIPLVAVQVAYVGGAAHPILAALPAKGGQGPLLWAREGTRPDIGNPVRSWSHCNPSRGVAQRRLHAGADRRAGSQV